MTERAIERILQEEQDEKKVQEAIDKYLEESKVPGGRYWEPGVEENPVLPEDQWLDVEPEDLPFR